MKLRQREYCHNCDQHVIFEFEDVTGRQVILCPNCNHQHYRELDEATILDIQIDQTRGLGQFKVAKIPDMVDMFSESSDCPTASVPIEVKEYKITGYDENGRPILDGDPVKDGFDMPTRKVTHVTDRRWGVDPSQRG